MEWRPLCTTCAYPAEHVYTTYSSASNIRLTVCPQCNAFVDPLIESPPLSLALDLVLLKPRVFLHLLFNKGSPPRVAATSGEAASEVLDRSRSAAVYSTLAKLALATVLAETTVRIASYPAHLGGTLLRVVLELSAQLATSTLLTVLFLRLGGWYPVTAKTERVPGGRTRDGRRDAFLPALVPLVLLYTALIPLLLQLVLGIWYPGISGLGDFTPEAEPTALLGYPLSALLPQPVADVVQELVDSAAAAWAADPVWAGTRLLGGMSAGFGLRVLLPTRPWETTAIVLCGWGMAGVVGRWLDEVA